MVDHDLGARNAETGMAKWTYPIEPHDGSSSLFSQAAPPYFSIDICEPGLRVGMATNPTIYRRWLL